MLSSVLVAASALALGVSAQQCHGVNGPAGVTVRAPFIYAAVALDVEAHVDAKVDLGIIDLDLDLDVEVKAKVEAGIQSYAAIDAGILFGTDSWHLSHTSDSSVQNKTDVQCRFLPKDVSHPTTAEVDILFAIQGEIEFNTIFTVAAAVDVEIRDLVYADVWLAVGTGIISSSSTNISLVAHGCDGNGNAFLVLYLTEFVGLNIKGGFYFFSASPNGIDAVTVKAIVDAIVDIKIDVLSALVDVDVLINVTLDAEVAVGATIGDYVESCDAKCQANTNLANSSWIAPKSQKFRA